MKKNRYKKILSIFLLIIIINVLVWLLFYLNHFLFSIKRRGSLGHPPSLNGLINQCNSHSIALDSLKWKTFNDSSFMRGEIPQVVHYTARSQYLPIQFQLFIRKCIKLNPSVTFYLWTDEAVEDLLEIQKQTAIKMNANKNNDYNFLVNLTDKFQSFSGIKKADVIRLIVLYYFGGIYMDLDMECKVPFSDAFVSLSKKNDPLLKESTCLFDQEQFIQASILYDRPFSVMNNFIISIPKHQFLFHILESLRFNDNSLSVMDQTGPNMITNCFYEYDYLIRLNERLDKLFIANSNWFSPLIDNRFNGKKFCEENRIEENYGGWKKIGCKYGIIEYFNNKQKHLATAFLIHRFLHLGHSDHLHEIKMIIDICDMQRVLVPAFL